MVNYIIHRTNGYAHLEASPQSIQNALPDYHGLLMYDLYQNFRGFKGFMLSSIEKVVIGEGLLAIVHILTKKG
uniref:hypothetical protein n=1 Tax=Fulvivirga sp. TaxID=1931237 RepID=UPI00404A87A7